MRTIVAIWLLVIFSSCHSNPVGSGGGFPVKAGPILFISDRSGTRQLYSMNEDGLDVQQLTSDSTFPVLDARWSPDGSKIAIVSQVGDETTYPSFRNAIFVMDADGNNRYQLTPQWFCVDDSVYGKLQYGGATGPVWSPDSKQIMYSRLVAPEKFANQDIFMISVDGTEEQRVTGSMSVGERVADWSPDGRWLLVDMIDWSKADSRIVVSVYSVEGRLQRQITGEDVTSNGGAWKPDQKYFALTSWSGSRHEIFRYDSGGGDRTLITTTGRVFNYIACWSPDGKGILVNSTDGESSSGMVWQAHIKDLSTGSLRLLSPFGDTSTSVHAMSWRRR